MADQRQRPKYLNLFQFRFPITGIVSIAHRISGVLMVLLIPLSIYLLDLSLSHRDGFDRAADWFASPWAHVALAILAWVAAHHLFAGIRFLLLDLDIGIARPKARAGAWAVAAAGVVVFLIVAGGLW